MSLDKIILGTVQFGLSYGIANKQGKIDFKRGNEIIRFAEANRINTLDTAIAYGDSEKLLGEIEVNNWKIISKLPPLESIFQSATLETDIISYLQNSLKNLRVEKLHGLLLHNPEDLLSKSGDRIFKTLLKLKNDNSIEKIGISIYNPSQLDSFLDHFEIDIVQAPFNLLDTRMRDEGYIDKLRERKIEFHCRSIFLQGLLLMNQNAIPSKFKKWQGIWMEIENFKIQNNISSLDMCISFIKKNSEIDKIVMGVDSKDHMEEIINSFKKNIEVFPDIRTNDLDIICPSNWERL